MATAISDWSDIAEAAKAAVGNWRTFESFAWHHGPDDADDFCIVYHSNRDSRLLEQSNADAIIAEMKPFTEGDDPDAIAQRHSHWAVGWVDGYAIRVFGLPAEVKHALSQLDDELRKSVEVLLAQLEDTNLTKEQQDTTAALIADSLADDYEQYKKFNDPDKLKRQPTAAFRKWCEIQEKLSDYPVLDDSDYCQREHEATIENIRSEGARLVIDEAPDDWADRVFSWLWGNEQKEVENRDDQGGYPSKEALKRALRALYLLDPEEWPVEPYPAHVEATLLGRIDDLDELTTKKTLKGVLKGLLSNNGNYVWQLTACEDALRAVYLWPQD